MSLKQLNNTSTQVIHKNDTGLDQDGIYGLAATAKSLVSEAVAQRHYLEKVGICSDELSHTVFCKKAVHQTD